jgi:hypothetical protein
MLEAKWKERLGLLGKAVVVELANGRVEGRVTRIGFDGVTVDEREMAPEAIRHIEE